MNKISILTRRYKLNSSLLALIVAIFLVVFANFSFWSAVLKIVNSVSIIDAIFVVSIFFTLVSLVYLFVNFVNFRYLLKPVVIVTLVVSSVVSYFMDTYGIMIDKTMVQNIAGTDTQEALELISLKTFLYLIAFGVVPSLLVLRIEILYKPILKQFITNIFVAVVCLTVIVICVFPFYKEYSSLARNNRYLRNLINPVNYLHAVSSQIKFQSREIKQIQVIGDDAGVRASADKVKKNLVILVVGETARAASFSLNGYKRKTNPLLTQKDIIYFNNAHSCGTATAVSLPCMFSKFDRKAYSDYRGKAYENLLDVLSHAGISVFWRENNTGCKGVCKRVKYQDMSNAKLKGVCKSGECFDAVLLYNLQQHIDALKTDAVIVLHQNGSHGPTYYRRYPKQFEKFTPVCATNQLQKCTDEQLINVYDNTILYTDYILENVITLLKNNSRKYNTAMIYMSDHGESLGENGIYLHGIPYAIAPMEQTHIPFLVWFSQGFVRSHKIDRLCLSMLKNNRYEHDHLFHTIIGMMRIKTKIYNSDLDVFSTCTQIGSVTKK